MFVSLNISREQFRTPHSRLSLLSHKGTHFLTDSDSEGQGFRMVLVGGNDCAKDNPQATADLNEPKDVRIYRSPSLMDLSIELRLAIYSYITPRRQIIEADHPGFNSRRPTGGKLYSQSSRIFGDATEFRQQTASPHDPRDDLPWNPYNKPRNTRPRQRYKNSTSIFCVSKQISNEALDVLYGDNIFVIRLNNDGEHKLKNTYTKSYRDRMRYLLVIAQHRSVLYGRGSSPDATLWASMLPHVNGLWILTKPPVRLKYTQIGKSDDKKSEEWAHWLRPFLQCFKDYLPEHATVIVDDMGKIEEGNIVQEYFPVLQ